VTQRSKGLLMRATCAQSDTRQMITDLSSAWLARKVPTCAARTRMSTDAVRDRGDIFVGKRESLCNRGNWRRI